ncbi:hypothetical protein AQUCO_06500037v1 [Aquilegia coerulea]|uniref:Bromo domain-containing protein n=1 Tax=Aquilegia coerulea TaxID=218851 RepID=A0A2G5CDK8_AQUCA|nr:hypothetical protein AQUCO_06500037v1 [Aquilegia coerulea]
MEEAEMLLIWGTWEELVLGGAVLRHGTRSWDIVAAELRSRTLHPYYITAEACKAKYQDLRKRYSGCNAWFEELRKQRVAQLKRELDKSDGSIGSLETKIESLKSLKREDSNVNANYASGHTESPPSVGNLARVDFPSKEASAGSFTHERRTNWSAECQIPATVVSTQEPETKLEEGENVTSKETILKKKRGKRKRKDCGFKQMVVDQSGSRDDKNQVVRPVYKDESTGDCDRAVRSSNDIEQNDQKPNEEEVDLMSVLNSIVDIENALVFRRRTDSQRRGKYKNMIRQHMDLNTLRSRVSDRVITTVKELKRDLLLLCSNAIVFYRKESREYKAAISLRDFVTKTFRHDSRVPLLENGGCSALMFAKPLSSLLVKPRSASFGNRKVDVNVAAEANPSRESKKTCAPEPLKEMKTKKVVSKKVVNQPVKVQRSGGSKRVETPGNAGRKRARTR